MRRVVTYTYGISEPTQVDVDTLALRCLAETQKDVLALCAIKEDGKVLFLFINGQAFAPVWEEE